MDTKEIFEKLAAPFPAEAIDWRVGATNQEKTMGIALAYIQARPLMDRWDETLGPENWQDEYLPIMGPTGLLGMICNLSARINGEWITKSDSADITDVEAIKGATSDAFKRASVKFGMSRYLYDLPTVWVAIEARGKSHILKETPKLPAWALPKNNRSVQKPRDSESTGKKNEAGPQNSIIETPELDPIPEPTQEGTPAEVSRLDKLATMTIEEACKVRNSDGTAYMDMTPEMLSNMSIGIGKALSKKGLDPETFYTYRMKLQAIKVLLQAKNEGAIQ